MKTTTQKLYLAMLVIEYRLAALSGNGRVSQNAIEKIVLLHTQMRVEKEHRINNVLFRNL
jgi:hypothetical protein